MTGFYWITGVILLDAGVLSYKIVSNLYLAFSPPFFSSCPCLLFFPCLSPKPPPVWQIIAAAPPKPFSPLSPVDHSCSSESMGVVEDLNETAIKTSFTRLYHQHWPASSQIHSTVSNKELCSLPMRVCPVVPLEDPLSF